MRKRKFGTALTLFLAFALLLTGCAGSPGEVKTEEKERDASAEIMKADGTILFENHTVTMDALVRRLKELRDSSRKYNFFLRADENLRYGTVIDILRTIKNAGFTELSLITSSEE